MNQLTKGLLLFAMGFAAGVASVYIKNHFDNRPQDVVINDDDFEDMYHKWKEDRSSDKAKSELDEIDNILKEMNYVDSGVNTQTEYVDPAELEHPKEDAAIPESEPEGDNDDEDEYDYDEEDEIEVDGRSLNEHMKVMAEAGEPYIITDIDFFEEEKDFDKISLVYYDDDDYLVDERNEVIDDREDHIGDCALSYFGEFRDHPDCIYVRNPAMGTDYEITRVYKSWEYTNY